ncbi:MAG: extracellular solute-binding protein [Chloroflexi bacterium]|nr:extracellular solute-binding protein [Chloroflexota bacterium]
MKVSRMLMTIVVLLSALLIACAPQAEEKPATGAATIATPGGDPRAPWQVEWDKVVQAAKQEGNLVLTTAAPPSVRQGITEAMKKYDIEVDFAAGRSAEIEAKVQAQQRAGLYLTDVNIGGSTVLFMMKPAGAIQPIDPFLILPEVLDPKSWYDNRLPWSDPEHFHLNFLAQPMIPLVINTDLVKPGEVKGYRDLLDPRWKGKLLMLNPSVGGAPGHHYVVTRDVVGPEFIRELLTKQEVTVVADARLHVEWVARGARSIGVWFVQPNAREFINAGAPLTPLIPAEGIGLSAGAGGVAIYSRLPHPNAAKVFVNWLLSKESGRIFAEAYGQSARVDVPTDFLDPLLVRQPGVKYHNTMNLDFAEQSVKARTEFNENFRAYIK